MKGESNDSLYLRKVTVKKYFARKPMKIFVYSELGA
jgi:hypothetical protein